MLYNIKNDFLSLTVTDNGGTMTSLIYLATGEERLWQGNEYWNSRDVVIFPIIGHAGEFTANGKNCLLKSHGLIRYATLKLAEKTDDKISMSFESNGQTLQNYPYEFEFIITYQLISNSVKISYYIRSKNGKMPFYVGGHPGMLAPNGEAIIEFENVESPVMYPVGEAEGIKLEKLATFVANKQLFTECKTLQLGSLSGGKIFCLTQDGYKYTYLADCPVVAFWSNENGGDYVCVEPWWGINDFPGAPKEITLKPFINFDDGKGSVFSYTLTVEKLN